MPTVHSKIRLSVARARFAPTSGLRFFCKFKFTIITKMGHDKSERERGKVPKKIRAGSKAFFFIFKLNRHTSVYTVQVWGT